jgi:ABC-type dipeptide/oligopeptide/nickel transport system ATPase component
LPRSSDTAPSAEPTERPREAALTVEAQVRLAAAADLPPTPSARSAPAADSVAGCPFARRCPQVLPRCRERMPKARELGPQHRVHCHLFQEGAFDHASLS